MDILASIKKLSTEELEMYGDRNLDFNLVGDFIDYGGQYRVFAYNTDKVIKIPMTKDEIFCRIANWGHETPDYETKYQQLVSSRDSGIDLVSDSGISASFLGNFELHNQVIVQDKVQVWGKIFDSMDEETQKNYLLQVVNLNIELWLCGLHEYVHNFSLNCGVDGFGNVVLIDFGEITNDKNKAVNDIQEGIISEAWSARMLPEGLREFYKKHVNQTLNLENLELCWKSKK
jgi:hypothetical protein